MDGRRLLATALSIALVIGSSTGARSQPARGETDTVSEVVVQASPGPALWHVRKGGSDLVILGSITPTPETGSWNTRLVAEALQGARVMLSPGSTPGFAWANNFPDSRRYLLNQPFGRKLTAELDPGVMTRFGQMAAAIHHPVSNYSDYRPGPAGMILLENSWSARGLTGSKLDDTVIGMAKAARVRVIKVDEGGALPLIDAMPAMSKAQHAACIGEAMDQLEWEGANIGAGYRAWSTGDLETLRSAYKPLRLCLDSIPGGLERRDKARAVWFKALADVLESPGRAVALADVSDLLEPSDLLAFLRAHGATVTRPRSEPASAPLFTSVATSRGGDVARPIDVLNTAPETLQLAPQKALRLSSTPIKIDKRQGRMVDLADDDMLCVEDTSIGTVFLHTTCHTRRQWTELEKHRSLDQMRDLTHNRRPTPDPG